MSKYLFLVITCLLGTAAWADESLAPLMNQVSLQLNAEQWVTSQSALVNVGVNAAVTNQGIEAIQTEVMQKLSQLSNLGEWHVLAFNRELDKSGLEAIQITAQARLPQTALGNLRDKAKAISKPGETFTIDNVQFVPSENEIRQANNQLRANIYQQAKTEVDALNKAYPEQKYYLHFIVFNPPPEVMPMPANVMMSRAAVSGAHMAPPLNVGNKLELRAAVVLASMPAIVTQKLTQHP